MNVAEKLEKAPSPGELEYASWFAPSAGELEYRSWFAGR